MTHTNKLDNTLTELLTHIGLSCQHIKHSFISVQLGADLNTIRNLIDVEKVEVPGYTVIDPLHKRLTYQINCILTCGIILELWTYYPGIKVNKNGHVEELNYLEILNQFTESEAPFSFTDLQLDNVDIRIPYELFESKNVLFEKLSRIVLLYQSNKISFREGISFMNPSSNMVISTNSYSTVLKIIELLTNCDYTNKSVSDISTLKQENNTRILKGE